MKKKVVALMLSMAMAGTLLAGCGGGSDSSSETTSGSSGSSSTSTASSSGEDSTAQARTDYSGVTIEMLNTKSEIQSQLEDAAEQWGELTGAQLDVYTIGSGSPSQEISARYAANNAPALIMGDIQDIVSICEENGADLSNESWVQNTDYAYEQNGVTYAFPLCIESRGLMYNKTAIEETLGEDWDPSSVTNMDDLKDLLDRLVENGMESPVALNMEDWSIAGHYFTLVYEEQDGTLEGAEALISELKAGTADLINNNRFNSLMDTWDLLMEYNINKDDPLAADYDMNAADFAEGTVAFWFNGNWAWAEVSDYYEEGTELGIMPVVQNDTTGNENVNTWLAGSTSKLILVDKTCNDEQQQAAAKDFLDWLANTPEGNSVLVDECSLVPAFNNIEADSLNDLSKCVQEYANQGKLFPGVQDYPGDHWAEVGAIMQKYLGGQIDRAEFAAEVEAYWEGQA